LKTSASLFNDDKFRRDSLLDHRVIENSFWEYDFSSDCSIPLTWATIEHDEREAFNGAW